MLKVGRLTSQVAGRQRGEHLSFPETNCRERLEGAVPLLVRTAVRAHLPPPLENTGVLSKDQAVRTSESGLEK
jgi:hypothetical protein